MRRIVLGRGRSTQAPTFKYNEGARPIAWTFTHLGGPQVQSHAVLAAGRPTAIGFTSSRPGTDPPMCAMYATPPDSVVFAIDPMLLINCISVQSPTTTT